MLSRRDFLLQASSAAASLPFLSLAARALAVSPAAPASRSSGLLFGPADLPRINLALNHPRLAPWWSAVLRADLRADTSFLQDQVRLNNHVVDMARVCQILERTSFAYAVTGDAAQGDLARRAVDKLLAYPKWDYFIDGSGNVIGLQRAPEAAIVMSLARQWLAPVLPKETAGEMERQIADKGAMACFRTLGAISRPGQAHGWTFDPDDENKVRFDLSRWPSLMSTSTLKVMPIAGLGVAGCLLQGSHPQAKTWIDTAVTGLRGCSTLFGPDGACSEGVGNWRDAAFPLHLAILTEVLRRSRGLNLDKVVNYPATVRFGSGLSMPVLGRPSDCVNFGDITTLGDVGVAAWTATRFNNPAAQHVAAHVGELKSTWAAIWLDAARREKSPGPELLDAHYSNDWVVARSGWGEQDGLVAMRSGGPSMHEHADRNSVIFKVYGERLLHDPYGAAAAPSDPLWLLRETKAHTALLIDNKGHGYHDGHEGPVASHARARIVGYHAAAGVVTATSDATEAYRLVIPDVDLVRRTMVFLKPEVLALVDYVRFKSTPLPVQVRYHTDNSDRAGSFAVPDRGVVTIQRPKANGEIFAFSGAPSEFRNGKLELPPELGVYPFVEHTAAPALVHVLVTVCLGRRLNEQPSRVHGLIQGLTASFTTTHHGRDIAVAVDLAPPVPVVSIEKNS